MHPDLVAFGLLDATVTLEWRAITQAYPTVQFVGLLDDVLKSLLSAASNNPAHPAL
jgi:hypothetical protein